MSAMVTGCSSSPPPGEFANVPAPASVETPLEPGDAIRISFSREPNLNGQFTVDETGSVALPLIGDVLVSDRSASAVKTGIEQEYSERTRNQSVQVVYLRRVRVLGEVRNPGIYLADPTMGLDDILALAGGTTSDGNLENVSLVREGEQVASGIDVRLGAAVEVYSGDQIFVPKTSWFSRNAAVLIGATISAIGVIVAFAT